MSDPSSWWINTQVTVPPELRAGLRLYGTAQRYEIAVALGRAMGLRLISEPDAHTWSYIYGLVDPLVAAIQEGSMLLETRAARIVRAAMEPMDVHDLALVINGNDAANIVGSQFVVVHALIHALTVRLAKRIDK